MAPARAERLRSNPDTIAVLAGDLFTQGDFLKRLAQSNARWFSSNTFDARGQPFPGVPEQVIFEARNPAGRSV